MENIRRKKEGRAGDIFTSGSRKCFHCPIVVKYDVRSYRRERLKNNKVIILVGQAGLQLGKYSRPEYNLTSLCRAGNQAQDFIYASQVLHQLNSIPSPNKVAIIDSYLNHSCKPERQLLCNWTEQSFLKFTHPLDLIKI